MIKKQNRINVRKVSFSTSTLLLHPFNDLFSRTTWISRCQKGKTSRDLNEARDDGVLGWEWYQLDYNNCTSLQGDNYTNTSPLIFLQARCSSILMPNQQFQSTEGRIRNRIK